MHATLICTTLWGGFWFQFVIGMLYNNPALYTLSRGAWFPPSAEFYFPVEKPFGCSLAEIFAFLSVLGSSLAMAGAWHWTRGVRGRWRMRATVAGFAGFLSCWSLAAWAAEDAAWSHIEDRREEIRKELARPLDSDWRRLLIQEKKMLERMLERRPKPP